MTKNERWILSEWRVFRDRTRRFSDGLLFHQWRTPYAEVDLVFWGREGLTMIEVKTGCGLSWTPHFVSSRQRARLHRARLHLEANSGRAVRLLLAVVSERDQVSYHEFL